MSWQSPTPPDRRPLTGHARRCSDPGPGPTLRTEALDGLVDRVVNELRHLKQLAQILEVTIGDAAAGTPDDPTHEGGEVGVLDPTSVTPAAGRFERNESLPSIRRCRDGQDISRRALVEHLSAAHASTATASDRSGSSRRPGWPSERPDSSSSTQPEQKRDTTPRRAVATDTSHPPHAGRAAPALRR